MDWRTNSAGVCQTLRAWKHLWGYAWVCDLTGHVHHPTAAHSQDLVGLAEQPAGADAVCVVSWELLLAAGAAVPPGLGQVGQLRTQRFIRPASRPARPNGCRRSCPSGGCDEEDLPSAPDTKQRSENRERRQSPAGGCREARPDCGSELGCRPPGMFRLRGETLNRGAVLCKRERSGEFQMHDSSNSCDSVRGSRQTMFQSRVENKSRRIIVIWRLQCQHESKAVYFAQKSPIHFKSNSSSHYAVRRDIICRTWPGEAGAGCIYSYINPSRGTACCRMRWDYNGKQFWSLLVSLQMGRYSSCWISNMISSPFPIPPCLVFLDVVLLPLKV